MDPGSTAVPRVSAGVVVVDGVAADGSEEAPGTAVGGGRADAP